MTSATREDPAALRAEHEDLARRLEARASIVQVKNGAVLGFLAFIAFGLSAKLAFDRWAPDSWWTVPRPPQHPGAPLFFLIAAAITIALAIASARRLRRARRMMREEAALFARFRQVRAALGVDR